MQTRQTCGFKVTPWLQRSFFLLIGLQLLLQLILFGLQLVHFVQHFQSAGCRGGCFLHRRSGGLKRLQQLFRSLQAGRQTDTVLQLRIVGNALLLFGHMHHTEVAHTVQECFVLLIIYKEREFLHFRNHASASFLFSWWDFMIFCDDLERFSSSSINRLILRSAS